MLDRFGVNCPWAWFQKVVMNWTRNRVSPVAAVTDLVFAERTGVRGNHADICRSRQFRKPAGTDFLAHSRADRAGYSASGLPDPVVAHPRHPTWNIAKFSDLW